MANHDVKRLDKCPCGRVKLKIGKTTGWFSKTEAERKLGKTKEKEPDDDSTGDDPTNDIDDSDKSDSLFD